MSKTRHKYNNDDDYALDGGTILRKEQDRRKQKRIERALRTKNIDELEQIENDGYDLDEPYDWDGYE